MTIFLFLFNLVFWNWLAYKMAQGFVRGYRQEKARQKAQRERKQNARELIEFRQRYTQIIDVEVKKYG